MKRFWRVSLAFITCICIVASSSVFPVYAMADEDTKLPESYDLRNEGRLTEVKAQGSMGSCWAISSVAALESFLLTSNHQEMDLSEANLLMMTSDTYSKGFDRKVGNGGDPALATAYYASWNGPVLESNHTYPESGMENDFEYNTTSHVVKHVQDVIFVDRPSSPLENRKIKEYIMKYGAIDAAMWKGTKQTFGRYFDNEHYAWYYPETVPNNEGNGHAIDIVGWDDNFSKENFAIMPPGDGAYLVRNTKGPLWGSPDYSRNMGGYFYISYYDGMLLNPNDSLVGGAVFTRVDDIDNYDHIYQYDELGYNGSLKSKSNEVTFANVFTVDGRTKEQIEAVSFYTLNNNLIYEIYVVDGFNSTNQLENTSPIKRGTIDDKGYHTVDLDKAIVINNTSVAILVKLISKSEQPEVAMEYPEGLFSSKAVSDGTSYIKLDGMFKTSANYLRDSNACLKMFTSNVEDSETKYSPSDMKKDVDFLVEWIKDHQPVVKEHGYSNDQLAIIEEVRERTSVEMNKDDYQLTINRLFTMLDDGHSILFYRLEDERLAPIPFEWLNDGMFITNSVGVLEAGDQVLQVGGLTITELEEALKSHISTENKYWLREEAKNYLVKWPMLEELGLVNEHGRLRLMIEREGEMVIVNLEPTNYFPRRTEEYVEVAKWWTDEANNVAVFRFDLFASGTKLEKMAAELEMFYSEVANKGISNVAFDIRNNPGGTAGMLNLILAYIMDDSQKIYAQGYMEYDFYKKYQKEWMSKFTGDTYLITGNGTFSCSVLATTILQDNGIAKVIGEPTGEKPAFNRHGNESDGHLPFSSINFMMTSMTSERPLFLDASIDSNYPDIPVYTTIGDLLSGCDRQIEVLKTITNENYEFFDKQVDADFYTKLIDVSSLSNSSNYSLAIKAEIKASDEDSYIPCTVSSKNGEMFIQLPVSVQKDKNYELLITDSSLINKYFVSFGQEESSKEYTGIERGSYVKKYNYFIIRTDVSRFDSVILSKTKLYDSNGDSFPIIRYQRAVDFANLHLLILPSDPRVGTVKIVFEPGAIIYTDGESNKENVELYIDIFE